ncbi:hypothetical protein ACV1DP_18275, partial [Aeromonas caviae]
MTQDALRHWRRDLHRHPEAAWCEFRTTTLIAQHLTELGFSIMLGDQLLASTLIAQHLTELGFSIMLGDQLLASTL